MAIYSLHHTPVGKSTQAQPYTAAAHIRYITRKNALSAIRQSRFPVNTPRQIADYLRGCEDQDRKNARVIDKVMLALPRELNPEQQIGLVRNFAEHVTKGRAPWLAAFHTKGKDRSNPHCHLVIRDRDPKTGKRVIGTSEIGSTERLRQQWEDYANRALKQAGSKERIDRRTLEAQGIQREPTIHEGPQSQAMDRRGVQPKSQSRRRRNRPGSRRAHRDVDYRAIDKGRSRPQLNRARRANGRETERDYWDAIDQDNQRREIASLRGIHNPHRAEPVEEPRRIVPSFSARQQADRPTADGGRGAPSGKVIRMSDHRPKRDKQSGTVRDKDQDSDRQGKLPLGRSPKKAVAKINADRPESAQVRKTFSQRQAEALPSKGSRPQGVDRAAQKSHETLSDRAQDKRLPAQPIRPPSSHEQAPGQRQPSFSQRLALGDRLLGSNPKPGKDRDRERER
jgi:hypothetical protein